MARLTEPEASRIAIVLEEKWAYEWREQKKLDRQARNAPNDTFDRDGFEEDFSFGEEDTNDYTQGTDCLDCDDPDELHYK